MLPDAARQWSGEQLRSVLLHELAHIKRRDTIVQLLAQVACALHWFNPLVWFAAWRLHVERERACDDLVLASGVRPSAYAGHLLDVVTGLSPARWTAACGLAMARKSRSKAACTPCSAKDSIVAECLRPLAGLALLFGAGIAIPIAMLRAADEKWNPPSGAHVGGNDFSAYCVHDGKDAAFVIAYHGDFGSSTSTRSRIPRRALGPTPARSPRRNPASRSASIAHTPRRTNSASRPRPPKAATSAKPAPPPREFGQKRIRPHEGPRLSSQRQRQRPPARHRHTARH